MGFNYRRKTQWFLDHLTLVRGEWLDIGCNVGNLVYLLRSQNVPVEQLRATGVDIAGRAVDIANARQIPGACFCMTSALDLPFPAASFDAVTMMEVIEHVTDQPRALGEVARVLKPGGILALSTPNAECRPWLFDEKVRATGRRILGRVVVEKDDALTLERLGHLLTDAGLLPVEGPRFYWYRPYHILKGHVCWPPRFVFTGLLRAMKTCERIEVSERLPERVVRQCCQSILAVARKPV